MKKLFFMLSLLLGSVLPEVSEAQVTDAANSAAQSNGTFVQDYSRGNDGHYGAYQGGDHYDNHFDGGYQGGYNQGGGSVAPGQEFACGEPVQDNCGGCYCLYCKYEPCYYNTWRTECEPKTCRKKCCRYVPKYYEKCCVKYVPQHYTQTCCKYEPEYYYVDECRYVNKRVCDRHCKYVPKYFYKRVQQPCCPPPCCE